MKKILFALCMFVMAGTAASAQKCTAAEKAKCAKEGTKCCAKTSVASADDTKVASFLVEADALAESNENIKREQCAVSGKVAYFEKSVCEKSGNVTWEEVQYDNENKRFTKVASASVEREVEQETTPAKKGASKACCASKSGAKSCAKKAENN